MDAECIRLLRDRVENSGNREGMGEEIKDETIRAVAVIAAVVVCF